MTDHESKTLACGCTVQTDRDFLGRIIGTITARDERCSRTEHVPGHTVVMPGREHARPEDR